MMPIQDDNYQRIYNYLINIGLILSITLLMYLILFSITFLSLEGPQEYRENAITFTTRLLLKGGNPYSLENIPAYSNLYGIVYNVIVYPFAKIFGPSFFIHRLVSLLFMLLSCGAVYWGLRKKNVSIQLSLIAFTLLYIQLFRNIGILARPDTLGLFLFLCSIIIPWKWNFTYSSLIGGILLSTLAFLTKPYFIFGAPCIALYLFLNKSKLKGIIYGLLLGCSLTITLLVMNHIYDYYIISTFLAHVNLASSKLAYLAKQTICYAKTIRFLIPALFIVYLLSWLHHKDEVLADISKHKLFNIKNLSKPLIRFDFDIMTLILICSVLVMLKMGQHTGASLLYYIHLISPFLIITIFTKISNETKYIESKTIAIFLIVIQLFTLNFTFAAKRFPFPLPVNRVEWQELKDLISPYNNVFCGSPPLAHIVNEQNKTVYDTGHSEHFRAGLFDSPLINVFRQSPRVNKAQKHHTQYLDSIKRQAKDKSFDLIIITKDYSPFLPLNIIKDNYTYLETKSVKMYFNTWDLDIWLPTTSSAGKTNQTN